MTQPSSTPLARSDCRVVFGGRSACVEIAEGLPVLRVALPVLAGASGESLLADITEPEVREHCHLFHGGSCLAGFAGAAPESDLESAAGDLYGRLFAVTAGRHLYRIWNYVPQINAIAHGMENYRRFCRGRSLAFERQFGEAFHRVLPASSAVGSAVGPLSVAFLAGSTEPRHFENPRQVPAFEYPPLYGPRPPSFSRATVVTAGSGRHIFISGTAAIRGHASVANRDLGGQLGCTLDNLAQMGEVTGAGPALGASSGWRRAFKIYLRNPADLPFVQGRLNRDLLRSGDAVSYLQAEICRSDLLLEIEATLSRPASAV